MTTIDSTLISMEENTMNANKVKELVLNRLYLDEIISEDQRKTYSEEYQMIIIKNGWFQRLCEKLNLKKEIYVYLYVKFNL